MKNGTTRKQFAPIRESRELQEPKVRVLFTIHTMRLKHPQERAQKWPKTSISISSWKRTALDRRMLFTTKITDAMPRQLMQRATNLMEESLLSKVRVFYKKGVVLKYSRNKAQGKSINYRYITTFISENLSKQGKNETIPNLMSHHSK